jgi:hypothetical protein
MSAAFVIELPSGTAGVAVRVKSGFCFFASAQEFQSADQRTFSTLRALRADLLRRCRGDRGDPRIA